MLNSTTAMTGSTGAMLKGTSPHPRHRPMNVVIKNEK